MIDKDEIDDSENESEDTSNEDLGSCSLCGRKHLYGPANTKGDCYTCASLQYG